MTEWKWIRQNTAKDSRWAALAKGVIDGKHHVIEWEVSASGPSQYSGMVRIDGQAMTRKEAILRYFAGSSGKSQTMNRD